MSPILIGYFAKRTVRRPDWLQAAGVDEVCSVSTCISEAPEGWIDRWRHNEFWLYDTPELADGVIPDGERAVFDRYAYGLWPQVFDFEVVRAFEIPRLSVRPLSEAYERLGWDVVTRSSGTSFECSPLSCNYRALHTPVNRYCLLEDVATACAFAHNCRGIGCEPGPYYVVEVWRRRPSI